MVFVRVKVESGAAILAAVQMAWVGGELWLAVGKEVGLNFSGEDSGADFWEGGDLSLDGVGGVGTGGGKYGVGVGAAADDEAVFG